MPRRPKGNQKGGPPKRDGLPGRDEIIEFIKTSPTKVGKREIARAFGVRGPQRMEFNRLLASMTEDGMLSGDRKSLRKKGGLPPVTILEVTGRDADGDLIAKPDVWEEKGERPEVLIAPRKARGPEVDIEASIGVGDRVLARISEIDDPSAGYRFEAFPIKRLPREKRRLIGIFRAHRNGGGSIEPVDRKQLRSWSIAKGDEGPAKDGDLVRFDLAKKGRFNVPQARVVELIGNPDDQRQISLIAVHAHGIPDDFPESVITESEALTEPTLSGRTDLRNVPLITIDPPDARDHDDAVYAEPDADPANAEGWIVLVAIADVAHFVRPDTKLDSEAQLRGNSVYFPDRVVPMLPERISNNLCSLREGENRACLVVRMIFDKDGNKRSHAFMRAMMRSAAKLSYQEAQAAIDGQPSDKAGPLLEPVLKPLWAAYAAVAAARDKRQPLDLDLPERKILLDEKGRVDKVVTPERLECPPADRRVHDPGERRRGGDAGAEAHAGRLSHPRPALEGEAVEPARLPRHARHEAAAGVDPEAGALQRHPRPRQDAARRRPRQRGGAAQPEPGRVQPRQHRPLRFEPAPLRALHLAHPPLCRPHRASRAGESAAPRRGRAGGARDRPPARGGAADLRCGAPRHGGRARDGGPPHRRASRRSDRRDVHRAHRRRDALGAVRAPEGYRGRRLRTGVVAAQRLLQSRRRASTRSSANARARRSGSATRWKCGSSRPFHRQEHFVSRC